ncbi:MAG: hypothetical protein AAGF26_05930 [Cyanobacteria bacterium P01_G01_bin.49]
MVTPQREASPTVGLKDSQGLSHFPKEAHWNVEKVREIRLWLTKLFIGEREITLINLFLSHSTLV